MGQRGIDNEVATAEDVEAHGSQLVREAHGGRARSASPPPGPSCTTPWRAFPCRARLPSTTKSSSASAVCWARLGTRRVPDERDPPRGAQRDGLDEEARPGDRAHGDLQPPADRRERRTLYKRRRCAGSTRPAPRASRNLRGQFSGRPVGVLMGWETSVHPFIGHPEYVKLAALPVAERVRALRSARRCGSGMVEGGAIRTDALPADAPIPPIFLQFLVGEHPQDVRRWAGATTTSPTRRPPSQGRAARTPAAVRSRAGLRRDDGSGRPRACSTSRSSGTPRAASTPSSRRMKHPQTGLSAWPTAAPTAARSATPARRPSC